MPTTASASASISIDTEDNFAAMGTKQTTGGHVWDAALLLRRHLEEEPPSGAVLELGSGTGWLGMALACDFTSRLDRVILTEMIDGGAFRWLEHNVQRNREAGLPLSACELVPLDWSWLTAPGADAAADQGAAALEQLGTRWDYILGSDLVYNDAGAAAVPAVIAALLRRSDVVRAAADADRPPTRVLYAHTLGRFEMLDLDFFDALRAEGLVWRVARDESADAGPPVAARRGAADGAVREHVERAEAPGSALREAAPEFDGPEFAFSGELFPDQRLVVLEIARSSSK